MASPNNWSRPGSKPAMASGKTHIGSQQPTSSSTSLVDRLSPSKDVEGSATPSTPTPVLDEPHPTLGRFSYAPATQTTVVTTTTTTTTSFPPMLFPKPRHLANRDPTQYPLAAIPTPASLKKLTFDLGGIPACFEEAENASESIHEVTDVFSPEYTLQQQSLIASNGVVQTVQHSGTPSKVANTHHNMGQVQGTLRSAFRLPAMQPGSRKRAASPVSIAEAAGLAQLQQTDSDDAVSAPWSSMRPTKPLRSRRGIDLTVGSVPARSSLLAATPGPIETASLEPRLLRPTKRRQIARPDDLAMSVASAPAEPPSALLSPQPVPGKSVSFVEEDSRSTTTIGSAQPSGETAYVTAEEALGISSGSIATATPPITDADLQLAPTDAVDGSEFMPPEWNHQLPSLNPSIAHDASLPSPSLSPVTAALHHGLPSSSVGDDEVDGDVDSSFALPPPREALGDSVTMAYDASSERSQDPMESWTMSQGKRPSSGEAKPSMMEMPAMLDAFDGMAPEMQTYLMYQFLRRCAKPTLQFISDVVGPALQVDFLARLPVELGLKIVQELDFQSLCRAAQVSRHWRQLIDGNEGAWKRRLDQDGYSLPQGELRRAIKEGWGWQIPYGDEDRERDVSHLATSTTTITGSEKMDSSSSSTLFDDDKGGHPAMRTSNTMEMTSSRSSRPKRKAADQFESGSRKRAKLNAGPSTMVEGEAAMEGLDETMMMEKPYVASMAARRAVPNPAVGLPSLRNMHLFKSIYRRHHLTRALWMQDEVKPSHIAFRAHQRHVVTCLQFDDDKILTGSDDTNINVYDTKTGALRTKLEGHEGGVWALQYEGDVLVSGSTDRSVRVWDIKRGVCTHVFQRHTSTVRCLKILLPTKVGVRSDGRPMMMPKEPLIITGSRDSTVRIWRLPQPGDEPYLPTGPPTNDADCPYFVRTLAGHVHSVRAIAAHGDTLVSGSYDATVRVWRLSTGETVHRLQGHSSKVYSVVLDHERNRCISGSMDNLVKVWSLDTGTVLFNLEGHASLVGLLDLSHDRLVSAAADATLRVWDPTTGQHRSTLTAHTGAITCFQHDGQKVVSGSDRTVKLWNIETGAFMRDLLADLSGVWQVKFDDRRCVAAVQRNSMTYLEVLDFGSPRDNIPEEKRGRRIVVDTFGQEIPEGQEGLEENLPPVE
ncbi:MAG: hypothetical protein M1823_002016 [Watsoniomyces obsoletus]|nr:MAG: hypothetical protein M1823_002016 [Watsoniomyces obsoletus]